MDDDTHGSILIEGLIIGGEIVHNINNQLNTEQRVADDLMSYSENYTESVSLETIADLESIYDSASKSVMTEPPILLIDTANAETMRNLDSMDSPQCRFRFPSGLTCQKPRLHDTSYCKQHAGHKTVVTKRLDDLRKMASLGRDKKFALRMGKDVIFNFEITGDDVHNYAREINPETVYMAYKDWDKDYENFAILMDFCDAFYQRELNGLPFGADYAMSERFAEFGNIRQLYKNIKRYITVQRYDLGEHWGQIADRLMTPRSPSATSPSSS